MATAYLPQWPQLNSKTVCALEVPCPGCTAAEDEPCKTLQSATVRTHMGRIDRAEWWRRGYMALLQRRKENADG